MTNDEARRAARRVKAAAGAARDVVAEEADSAKDVIADDAQAARDVVAEEARGLRSEVRQNTHAIRVLVWAVVVQAVLVATLAGLVGYLFVAQATAKRSLAAGSQTLQILEGCLSPGPRTPTADNPATGNACFDQIAASARARTNDVRLSIDCSALWLAARILSAAGLPVDPPSVRCADVVGRIEALRGP